VKQGVKHTIKKNAVYFMTITVVKWVPVFKSDRNAQIIIDSLKYCIKNKGLNIYAFCLMSNHLHLIANCDEPNDLAEVMRDFKRHTAKTIFSNLSESQDVRHHRMAKVFTIEGQNYSQNVKYKFWQTGNHAIELYNPRFTWKKLTYIHNNPVTAGLAEKPGDWKYSSARNYMGKKGVIDEIICLSHPG